MPRYFFHIRKANGFDRDPEGIELASNKAALEEAVLAAREILAEKIRLGEVVDGDTFEIRNDEDAVVHLLPFRAVLKLE